MSRKQPPPLPPAPFKMGELVKFRTRDGAELLGSITLVGWCPFPGMWSFEIKTATGERYTAPGNIKEIEKAEAPAAAPMIEKTAAGDQAVIAGAEVRHVPDAKLRPKRAQRESLTALEAGAIEDKQQPLLWVIPWSDFMLWLELGDPETIKSRLNGFAFGDAGVILISDPLG